MRQAVAPLEPQRDLPWRRTRDPWAVLVAEVMLQQTQVPRVVPRWHDFLERFPTPRRCAAASVGDVVRAWQGLGYNRRAVALHGAASAVVRAHDGVVPADLDALLALPGIGPYTARAVLAFAFERAVCPLDVNTARPLARAYGVTAQVDADAVVPPDGEAAWRFTQGLMDLGALVCRRRSPHCEACPWRSSCAWHGAGHPDPDPASPAVRQDRFEGSDRQGRGRLVAALGRGPLPDEPVLLAATCGWPDDPDRAERVVRRLVADGLVVVDPASGTLRLP